MWYLQCTPPDYVAFAIFAAENEGHKALKSSWRHKYVVTFASLGVSQLKSLWRLFQTVEGHQKHKILFVYKSLEYKRFGGNKHFISINQN